MSFGSPSASCRIQVNVVRLNVAFGLMSFSFVWLSVAFGYMSFGLMSFGLMSFGLMSFGLMSFGLLSVYRQFAAMPHWPNDYQRSQNLKGRVRSVRQMHTMISFVIVAYRYSTIGQVPKRKRYVWKTPIRFFLQKRFNFEWRKNCLILNK